MADRYWVGGTDTWNATAGTKWAATSGGPGGETVPTTADDVYFDASSGAVTVTTNTNVNAKNLNFTGFTGTFIREASNTLTIAGSLTAVAGMTWTVNFTNNSQTSTVSFTSNAAGNTVTTAGKLIGSAVVFNGTGDWTLQDDLTLRQPAAGSAGGLYIGGGTFNSNDKTITIRSATNGSATFQVFPGSTKVINLGSSIINIGITGDNSATFQYQDNAQSTANATTFTGTYTFRFNTNGLFLGLNNSYNNLDIKGSTGSIQIFGTSTFNDVSVEAQATASYKTIVFYDRVVINGSLSTSGTAGNRRVLFLSDSGPYNQAINGGPNGSQTITINGTTSLTDADFQDLYFVGTAAPISGTRIGNRGNCRGITFSAPKNVYWNLSGSQNWSANGWASGSGGSPNTDNFPLPQDTAIFDNAGSAGTVSLNALLAFTGSVDMSARTSAMTISFAAATTCYGSWTNGSGTTLSGTQTLTFSGQGTKTITSAGKTFSCTITVNALMGTIELADAFNFGTQPLTITNGTFDTKNYNVTGTNLSSSNSNFRTVTLGSSTITLSANAPLTLTTSTNLTFNANTSQINLSSASATLAGGSNTFYNVSFTNTSVGTRSINGVNTFNNLTLNASATGLSRLSIAANQTITGTFTCAGSSATARGFVRSDVYGTPRTLTVGTLAATDCDFRDITIAGTAAGSSQTRAGDCQGNSGITFPAAKNAYRVGTNTTWAGSSSWALTSGGAGSDDNFPLPQDTAIINEDTALTGTLALGASFNMGTLDCSARTTGITLDHDAAVDRYGSYILGSGVTVTGVSLSAIQTFVGRSAQTFTSAGKTISFYISISKGIVELGDAFQTSNVFDFFEGTFDAKSYNFTGPQFICSSSFPCNLSLGSGTWTLTGTATTWNCQFSGGIVLNSGTSEILFSDTSTTARTFAGGGLTYNKFTIGGATGTSTTTITGNNQFTEIASTKTVAHTIALGTTTQTFGKWTVTGTVGNVVTLTGTGTNHALAGSCTSGIDYLAMGSIGFAATSPGEFYAGANSTGTAAAPVYRTDKPADSTRYWVGGTGNWSDTNRWSTGSGGAGGASVPRSHDDVVFDSSSNATGYTATVDAVTGGIRMKALTIAGPATGNLTLAGSVAIFIHDDVTLPATGLTRTYTGAITLTSNGTGRTFVSNGVTLASAITVNGVDCEWTLGDALNIGSSTLTVTNGLIDFDTYNVTAGILTSDNSNKRTIDFGTGTATLSGNPTFGTTERNAINLVVVPGTSQINISAASPTFSGNGKTFYNVAFTSTSTGTVTINGANTFNNLSFTGITSAGLKNISISANQTINGTFTCSAGTNATMRHFVRSDTLGTTRTLTCNAVSLTDVDFRDITIAGSAAPAGGTRIGDCGGNSGITADAPKTVYRVGTDTTWAGSSSWALTSGGAGSNDNFPLAQDTAIINNDTTLTGTLGVATYNVGTLDCSTRTTGITLSHFVSVFRYGSYIFGSGVTSTGTSAQIFSGRGTQTFTSASKTMSFAITVDKPTGSFELGDAFITSVGSAGAITLTRGTFDAKNFNVTISNASGAFVSSNSNTRTLTMGSGTWTLSGTGTVWDISTSTNLTLNANTSEILLSDTSTTARTFSGGGMSYNKLTIGGATGVSTSSISGYNSFNEIASTKTVAHIIRFASDQNIIGTWSVSGSSGNAVRVDSSASQTRRLIKITNQTSGIDYVNANSIYVKEPDKFYVGANSINLGNTFNVFFTDAPAPPSPSGGAMFLLFM
jgi:hypothetical protein